MPTKHTLLMSAALEPHIFSEGSATPDRSTLERPAVLACGTGHIRLASRPDFQRRFMEAPAFGQSCPGGGA